MVKREFVLIFLLISFFATFSESCKRKEKEVITVDSISLTKDGMLFKYSSKLEGIPDFYDLTLGVSQYEFDNILKYEVNYSEDRKTMEFLIDRSYFEEKDYYTLNEKIDFLINFIGYAKRINCSFIIHGHSDKKGKIDFESDLSQYQIEIVNQLYIEDL